MMGTREGGMVILISHYAAAPAGIMLSLLSKPELPLPEAKMPRSHCIRKTIQPDDFTSPACTGLCTQKDGRPIGRLMGDTVRNSVNVLLVVTVLLFFFQW